MVTEEECSDALDALLLLGIAAGGGPVANWAPGYRAQFETYVAVLATHGEEARAKELRLIRDEFTQLRTALIQHSRELQKLDARTAAAEDALADYAAMWAEEAEEGSE